MTAVNGQLVSRVRNVLATLANESTNSGRPGEQPAPAGEPMTVVRTAGGRAVDGTGLGFGLAMSVVATILHTWLPAPCQPTGWSPRLAAQIGAAVWPIGLLLSIEVLSRVRWPQGWDWAFVRHRYRIGMIGLTDAETAELDNLAEAVTW